MRVNCARGVKKWEVKCHGCQRQERAMMVLSVPSKTPHCKGNESQDTVALLETTLMSIEREMRLREAEGFMKATWTKSETDEEHGKSRGVVRQKTALGWGAM
jgi:hypothetical protein